MALTALGGFKVSDKKRTQSRSSAVSQKSVPAILSRKRKSEHIGKVRTLAIQVSDQVVPGEGV
jgi:hypothetical protein